MEDEQHVSGFERLPAEVGVMLLPDLTTEDLHNLSLVSHALHDLAVVNIWKEIALVDDCDYACREHGRKLLEKSKILAGNPQIASCVRTLTYRGLSFKEKSPSRPPKEAVLSSPHPVVLAMIKQASANMTGLQRLMVWTGYERCNDDLVRILVERERVNCTPLHHLRLEWDVLGARLFMCELPAVAWLPKSSGLRHLQCLELTAPLGFTKFAVPLLGSVRETLTSLRLDSMDVNRHMTKGLIAAGRNAYDGLFELRFPHLKSFEVLHSYDKFTMVPEGIFMCDESPMLARSTACLEFLEAHPGLTSLGWPMACFFSGEGVQPELEARIHAVISHLGQTLTKLTTDSNPLEYRIHLTTRFSNRRGLFKSEFAAKMSSLEVFAFGPWACHQGYVHDLVLAVQDNCPLKTVIWYYPCHQTFWFRDELT